MYVEKSGSDWKANKIAKQTALAPADVYQKAKKDGVKFWEELALHGVAWSRMWDRVYQKEGESFSWFRGGRLNLCYNAVDRHLHTPDNLALIFAPDNPDEPRMNFSYFELYKQVNNAAAQLLKLGVKKGDKVAILMPKIPEHLIFILACARIGAVHVVLSLNLPTEIVRRRIEESGVKVIAGADYYFLGRKKIFLKKNLKKACKGLNVKKFIVKRKKIGVTFVSEKMQIVKPVEVDSEEKALIFYKNGGAGKAVTHPAGGYCVNVFWGARFLFNLQEHEVVWCTEDIGSFLWQTYGVYAPLLNGATTVFFEGALDFPTKERVLQIIQDTGVTVFYSSPRVLRFLSSDGDIFTRNHSLESLKILASGSEMLDAKTWKWLFENVGKKRCPVIETYYQSELGGVCIGALPGQGNFVPLYLSDALPGSFLDIVDERGKSVRGRIGLLVERSPFSPSLSGENLGGIQSVKEGIYYTGDVAVKTEKGMRVVRDMDEVRNFGNKILTSYEIESAVYSLPDVQEVLAFFDKKGLIVFVKSVRLTDEQIVSKEIVHVCGAKAKPCEVYFVEEFVKNFSGNTNRKLMKALAQGENVDDLSVVLNPASIGAIQKIIETKRSFASEGAPRERINEKNLIMAEVDETDDTTAEKNEEQPIEEKKGFWNKNWPKSALR